VAVVAVVARAVVTAPVCRDSARLRMQVVDTPRARPCQSARFRGEAADG
jgi:hypothetical protein